MAQWHEPRHPALGYLICGKRTADREPCYAHAGRDTDHEGMGWCAHHGGNTVKHRVALAREEALRMAREHAEQWGLELDIDPTEALLLAVRIAAGEVAVLTRMCNTLSPDQWIGEPEHVLDRPQKLGKEGEDPSVRVTEHRRLPTTLHVWIRARQDAVDRMTRAAKAAHDAGVARALVERAQTYAQDMAAVVAAAFERLTLTDEQLRAAPEAIASAIREFESGSTAGLDRFRQRVLALPPESVPDAEVVE